MPQGLSALGHFLLERLRSVLHVRGHVDENACVREHDLGHGGDCGCGLHVTIRRENNNTVWPGAIGRLKWLQA